MKKPMKWLKRTAAFAAAVAMAATITFPTEIRGGYFDGFGNAIVASAADYTVGGYTITTDDPTCYSVNDDNQVIVLNSNANVTISGSDTVYTIRVPENATNVKITLNNCSVLKDAQSWRNAIELLAGSSAKITLKGVNNIQAGRESSAIRVTEGASLEIYGPGTLNASIQNGGSLAYSAVIGSQYTQSCGNISIYGGTINANSGSSLAAAIGTALYWSDEGSSNGTITLNGGTINANRIGGIDTSANFNVVGNGGAIVNSSDINADTSGFNGIVFNGNTGTVYGNATVTENLEIPAGHTMTIPEGAALTVGTGVTLTNNGTIVNNGLIANDGVITGNDEITGNAVIDVIYLDPPEADDGTFIYNGTEQTFIPESEYYTVSDNKQTNAGTYDTVTVSLKNKVTTKWSDGTTADKEYTFTIAKAELTVTAESYTVMVGKPLPETLEYTVSGLKGTDTLESIGVNVAVSYAGASVPSDIGEYVIAASGKAETDNYTITYVNGKLTITAKAVQTITANDVTLSYSDTDGKINASTDGGGVISYEVATGADVISVDENGNITPLKTGTATVKVKASETADYAAAEKVITVTVTDCEHNDVSTDWYKDKDYHWHKCGSCTAELDKAEHTFSDWLIVNEATEESDGTRMRACTVCGYEQSESIEYVPDDDDTDDDDTDDDDTDDDDTDNDDTDNDDTDDDDTDDDDTDDDDTDDDDTDDDDTDDDDTDEEEKPVEVKPSYPIGIRDSRITVDRISAKAGESVSIRVPFGYDAVVYTVSGQKVAQITENGSFVMPASRVYIRAVMNDTLKYMANSFDHSYVYSYDSDMNRIKINSTRKRGIIVINLGDEYAGCEFTVYEGRKSTSVKVTEGVLDENGRYTLDVDDGKNYTLIVEE